MAVVKYNSNVLLHYSLKGNGQVFESTYGGSPIKLKIGQSSLPKSLRVRYMDLRQKIKKNIHFHQQEIYLGYMMSLKLKL